VIGAAPLPPTPGQVVAGVAAVLVGALVAATCAHLARRTRNWLYHVGTVGGLLVVAGLAGQRTSTGDAITTPWDAGLVLPILDVRLNPVTAAGIALSLLGLSLTLLFERVPDGSAADTAPVHRRLEDDDAV
jgi:hypothetical protein